MSDPSVRRGIASTRLLCGLGLEHGLSASACLAGTGITPAQLDDPHAEIAAAQEFGVIANLLEHLGAQGLDDLTLALAAGSRYHLTTMGIWGFAMAASATLGSAVQVGLRYLDLTYSLNRVWLDPRRDTARLVIDEQRTPPELARFVVVRDMAAMMTINRELLAAPVLPRAVHLRFPAPDAARIEALTTAFGCRPAFDAASSDLEFDLQLFAEPLPQANELMQRACEEQCLALLARRRGRVGIAGAVRERLLRTPGVLPDMETIAADLNLTARHLRRRLSAEGTSYRALADEVRQALAEELLSTARMKMDEVAERLGYSDRASFTHAFKRWKGVPPSQCRG